MYTAAVITVSDKGFAGERVDTGGPLVCELLKAAGYEVAYTALVPDDVPRIAEQLKKCADELDIALAVTTGGTGFSPRDVTPEATIQVCERLAPGIPEAMRWESMKITNRAMLSRAQAGGFDVIVMSREFADAYRADTVYGLEGVRVIEVDQSVGEVEA